MQVHQLLTALSYGDAIGDDALAIQRILRAAGHDSDIYCQLYHPRLANRVKRYDHYQPVASPDNVVIFHFSIGSPVSQMIPKLPDRKILIYHNITPARFFVDTNMVLTQLCHIGRTELRDFVSCVELALGDSDFNRRELEEVGYAPTAVLPIIADFSKFERRSEMPRRIHGDAAYTFSFVGRVIPNKRIDEVIRAFSFYQKHIHADSRLFIVGDYRGFERYYWRLLDLVSDLGAKRVHFTGHVTDEEIAAYYELTDVFVCMSEHEGFCVPLLEAFHFGIPVIACNFGAVPETMRGAGVLLEGGDYAGVAEAAEQLRADADFRAAVIEGQRQALEYYNPSHTGRMLLDYVVQVAARP